MYYKLSLLLLLLLGAQYDPLRCFSITTKNSKGWKWYDMKSHSGLHCQQ